MHKVLLIEMYYLTESYYWPAPPDDPQGIRVASVIEFSVCLFVCLFVCLSVCLSVLCKFSKFFLQYKAAALQKNVSRMNTDVLASYTQNIAQGQENDSRINAVYSGLILQKKN